MATQRYWSASAGENKVTVVENAATQAGATVEVRITYDNAAFVGNKAEVLRTLDTIRQRLVEETWPPA